VSHKATTDNLSFWEHLEQLRGMLWRVCILWIALSLVLFVFKDEMFGIILAPRTNSFITYRWLNIIASLIGGGSIPDFSLQLINTEIAGQFMTHVRAALCVGFVLASPYIVYAIFGFVAPGLYENERKYAWKLVTASYLLFAVGALVSYLLIFPLTFRFLGMYQVDSEVPNMITLDSYISTLLLMSITMGIVFEIPVVMWMLGKMGIVRREHLSLYRRHTIVAILIIAAIITPTGDALTLVVVSLPMYLLYEAGLRLIPK